MTQFFLWLGLGGLLVTIVASVLHDIRAGRDQ